ncbi:MAG TPA: hypothetical protein VLE44_03450 [Candidatus Saccharimonadales bacterium]|nr:hypothetical protein [Candidatus Saccharimonadales bacterium]
METYSNSKGQSFFEVVVAMGLISIVLVTLVAMASLSIRATTFSRSQTEAVRLTQQASEWLRGEKDASWTIFKTRAASGTWCLDSLTWSRPGTCSANNIVPGTIFTRQVKFTNIDAVTIQSDIQTTWADAQGTHTSTTGVIFTNWK